MPMLKYKLKKQTKSNELSKHVLFLPEPANFFTRHLILECACGSTGQSGTQLSDGWFMIPKCHVFIFIRNIDEVVLFSVDVADIWVTNFLCYPNFLVIF
jgi:hypothetical protein